MELGKLISDARNELGMTQVELRDALVKVGCVVSYGWVANAESGRLKKLKPEHVKGLAEVLRKAPEYFKESAGGVADKKVVWNVPKEIAIVSIVSAEYFAFSFENPPEGHLEMTMKLPAGRKVAAVRVSGDCMVDSEHPEKSIYDGEYVIILEPVPGSLPIGKIVVAEFNGEYTLKKLLKTEEEGKFELRPSNNMFKSKFVKAEDLRIVGVVYCKQSMF